MHSRERLANDLRKLGVGYGDIVMVRASVRAVGEIAGGPASGNSEPPLCGIGNPLLYSALFAATHR